MPADGFAPLETVGGPDLSAQQREARVIVVGNEKGGAGKSTVSMHLSVALMRMGKKVGVIDLDVRQRSLTRYLENRLRWMQSTGAKLPMPEIVRVDASTERDLDKAESEETQRFLGSVTRLKKACDFIIIDGPGGDTFLSRLAQAFVSMASACSIKCAVTSLSITSWISSSSSWEITWQFFSRWWSSSASRSSWRCIIKSMASSCVSLGTLWPQRILFIKTALSLFPYTRRTSSFKSVSGV